MEIEIDFKTIRGVVVLNNDRFKTLHVDGRAPRRTITYQGNSFPELFFEELQQGDNIIFVALSDDPTEPERIMAANLVLGFNLIPITVPDTTPNTDTEQKEITIEFTAMKTMDENRAVLSMLKNGKFGNAGNRGLLDDLYGSHTQNPVSDLEDFPLVAALKDLGPMHLDPPIRNVLGTTPFEYVVPIRGNTVLKVRTPVRVNGRVYPVIQPGEPIPQHRHTYLFIQHTHDNKPMGGFILPGVFLSEYIGKTEYLPGLPSNLKWVDRREAEQVVFDFRPEGEQDKWVVIAVHACTIVYSDPTIEHQLTGIGTLLQPNAPLPAEPVNVLLLDYDVIPGTATCVYRACNVDLNKIVKDGRIEFTRPPEGLPGFIIDDAIFSEVSPYDFQLYGDYKHYPRFRE